MAIFFLITANASALFFTVLLPVLHELVAGLTRKRLEVAHGSGVGRQNADDLA